MRRPAKEWGMLILWGLLAVLPAVGLQAQGMKPVRVLMAVDSHGREIGVVLRVDFSLRNMQVGLEVNREMVVIQLRDDTFSHGSRPVVYYQSANCSGLAYMAAEASDGSFGPPVAVAGPEATLYWGEPRSRQALLMGSVQWPDKCESFGARIEVMDATPVLDLAREFTPPFELQEVRVRRMKK